MIYILQAVKNLKTFASFKQAHDTFEISGAERPQTQLQPPGKTWLLRLSSLFFSARSSARSPGRELRSGQEWLAVVVAAGAAYLFGGRKKPCWWPEKIPRRRLISSAQLASCCWVAGVVVVVVLLPEVYNS